MRVLKNDFSRYNVVDEESTELGENALIACLFFALLCIIVHYCALLCIFHVLYFVRNIIAALLCLSRIQLNFTIIMK